MVKRILDLLLIFVCSPILIPLIIVVAVLVRTRLGGPVFFTQQRAGKDGRLFDLIKFRSMTNETDDTGVLLSDAERLTKFGRALRATSFDELPSLFNVVCGHMSLVGPRPLLPEYLPLYSPRQFRRHEVLPGVTGWAQINGRNSVSWEEKFELDVWYVDNRHLLLDVSILWSTVFKVLRRDGISAADQATMTDFEGSGL